MPEVSRVGPDATPADLLHWPCSPASNTAASSPSRPRVIVLFVPGNPGLAAYYTRFLDVIHGALASTEVYALGHLGHSPAHTPIRFTARGAVSLRDQVEHKVAFIDQLAEEHGLGQDGEPELVLIGHSIGAWICCEALKARPNLVSSLHLLFPTISHMRTTPNGRRLSLLFTSYLLPPVALVTSLFSFLPTRALQPVVQLLTGQTGPGATVTTQLVASPGTVVAALGMAAEEMRDVKELDKDVLRRYGQRMTWYWAAGDDDGWVSQSSIDEICDVLDGAGIDPSLRHRCQEGMQHAFVLSSKHTDSLAEKAAGWIRDAVEEVR